MARTISTLLMFDGSSIRFSRPSIRLPRRFSSESIRSDSPFDRASDTLNLAFEPLDFRRNCVLNNVFEVC